MAHQWLLHEGRRVKPGRDRDAPRRLFKVPPWLCTPRARLMYLGKTARALFPRAGAGRVTASASESVRKRMQSFVGTNKKRLGRSARGVKRPARRQRDGRGRRPSCRCAAPTAANCSAAGGTWSRDQYMPSMAKRAVLDKLATVVCGGKACNCCIGSAAEKGGANMAGSMIPAAVAAVSCSSAGGPRCAGGAETASGLGELEKNGPDDNGNDDCCGIPNAGLCHTGAGLWDCCCCSCQGCTRGTVGGSAPRARIGSRRASSGRASSPKPCKMTCARWR
mmetsp:Transcript_107020/g.307855  ORF Transcript_107020/g.307855 Transcript_107020/m.307855 type:complete len:278 (+) Transcript_107020:334-1167(+)